jgi:hypothetical protein
MDHPPVVNGSGYIAVVREANCPADFAQGTVYYVLFVHKLGVPNTVDNLVLQYEPGYPGFPGYDVSPPPVAHWSTELHLDISAPGILLGVQTHRTRIRDISISYSIGKVRWW